MSARTKEFDDTFPLPLDQGQHLMQQEGDNCKTLKQCTPCVMAMRQTGKTESLLPMLDRDPWPQPSSNKRKPVYLYKMTMTLLCEAPP